MLLCSVYSLFGDAYKFYDEKLNSCAWNSCLEDCMAAGKFPACPDGESSGLKLKFDKKFLMDFEAT